MNTVRVLLLALVMQLLSVWGHPVYAQTLARIQQSGQVSLGYLADQAPFSFQASDGKPGGYAVDLCNAVVESLKTRLQFPELRAKYVRVTRANGLDMVESGQVDVLCAAVPETLKDRERVSFSIPIYVGGLGVLVRADAPPAFKKVLNGEVARTGPTWRATVNGGLQNRSYAVLQGSATESLVRERVTTMGVIAKVVPVKTYAAGVGMLESGQVDAVFGDRAMLTTLAAERNGAELEVLERRFTLDPAGLALQRSDENFRLAVDTALSRLYRSGDVLATYSRHFGEPTETARFLFQAYSLP